MSEEFICGQCGGKFPMSRVGLGMNIGAGPEYTCDSCLPPGNAADTIKVIDAVVRGTRIDS